MPKFDATKIKLDSIHVLQNPDKGFRESWDKPKNRSLGCLPHPFTLLLLGVKNRARPIQSATSFYSTKLVATLFND